MEKYIISGIIGLIGGAIGSLVAPWVNWKLEQKKEQLKQKRELFFNLRAYLQIGECRNETFLNSVDYIKIRPYLSVDFVNELENLKKTILNSSYRSYYHAKFLEELDKIEESWNISLGKKGIKKSYQMKSGIVIEISQGE